MVFHFLSPVHQKYENIYWIYFNTFIHTFSYYAELFVKLPIETIRLSKPESSKFSWVIVSHCPYWSLHTLGSNFHGFSLNWQNLYFSYLLLSLLYWFTHHDCSSLEFTFGKHNTRIHPSILSPTPCRITWAHDSHHK